MSYRGRVPTTSLRLTVASSNAAAPHSALATTAPAGSTFASKDRAARADYMVMYHRTSARRDRQAIMRTTSLSRATDMLLGTGRHAGPYVRGCAAAFLARHVARPAGRPGR